MTYLVKDELSLVIKYFLSFLLLKSVHYHTKVAEKTGCWIKNQMLFALFEVLRKTFEFVFIDKPIRNVNLCSGSSLPSAPLFAFEKSQEVHWFV